MKKHPCEKIRAGKYLYRGYILSKIPYYEPEQRDVWEGVNSITNEGGFHAYTKRAIKNLIDIDLSNKN